MDTTRHDASDATARDEDAGARQEQQAGDAPHTHEDCKERSVDHKKLARNERKRQRKQELLRSMTVEQRRVFVYELDHKKENQIKRMRQVMEDGSGRVCLAIDLRYDAIMNQKELKSLGKQLKFVYGAMKIMSEPFQLRLFHCSEQVKTSLARFSAVNWVMHWHDHDELTDVMPAESIVYLSPDSPNVLETLDADKMYVIGGIVDKSRKKGATLEAATQAGITTARLPIQEYITERLDHILNVNTMVDVLIHFHTHGDWRRALTEVLPLRKQQSVGRQAMKRRRRQPRDGRDQRVGTQSDGEDHASDGRVDYDDQDAGGGDVPACDDDEENTAVAVGSDTDGDVEAINTMFSGLSVDADRASD